jgi:hypothetical protein
LPTLLHVEMEKDSDIPVVVVVGGGGCHRNGGGFLGPNDKPDTEVNRTYI